MNKAYRQVYKDGIGWVAIAENASCVSSSKGSGTVVEKSGVEVLKNFFDLRNSVVLNNGFLLKGLFAATLFCGVFVGDLKAISDQDIADIQNNGTVVYTDDQNFRVVESIESGKKIFTRVDENGNAVGEGGKKLLEFDGKYYDYEKILSMKQSDGSYLIDGKYYIIPDGTLGQGGMKERPVFVERDFVYSASGLAQGEKMARQDSDNKWYVYNLAGNKKLYYARFKIPDIVQENICNKSLNHSVKDGYCYGFWEASELKTEKVAGMDVLVTDTNGYYVKKTSYTTEATTANELRLYGKTLSTLNLPTGGRTTPERLSLVGKDGKSVTPIKYTADDQEVKDGKRKVGDNKNGTIRLGNVAKAEFDDEAVNLGQLNEKLQNVKADKVPYVSIKSSIKGAGSNYDSYGAKGDNAIAIGPNATAGDSSVAIGLNAKTGGGEIKRTEYRRIISKLDEVTQKYDKAVKTNDQAGITKFGKQKNELEEQLKKYDLIYKGKLITSEEWKNLNLTEQENVKYISNVTYKNSVVIGSNAQVFANDTVAIGNGAKVIANGPKITAGGGVAIGQGSVSNGRENKDLTGYEPLASDIDKTNPNYNESAWIATNQPFAVGDDKKITRQITGVAAGKEDTDAVNVAQLKQVGFYAEGDIGEKGRIQNEDKDNNILKIKTDGKWENEQAKTIYSGKNLETRFTPKHVDSAKNPVNSKFEIAMTDTPRFKSITIADELEPAGKGSVKNKQDNSPIELKKFGDNIGFAGKGDDTIKLTNLTDGEIKAGSTDAINGSQLYTTNESIKQNTTKITKNESVITNINRKLDGFNDSLFKVSNNGNNSQNIGLNGEIKFNAGDNIELTVKNDPKGANVEYKLKKDLTGVTSITTNSQTYKFGFEDPDEDDESVIRNKDLETKGYVTADTQKTTSVSTEADSGIKVVNEATGKNTDYKLSLDKDKVKEIAGTTSLTADLKGKANVTADNLSNDNVASWQNKLGINDKADKTEITNLTTKIDNGKFTSLKVSANGGTKDEIKANENIDFTGAKGINVNYDATKNKFTFSADSSVIGGAFSNKYAMLDGSNLKAAQGFKKDVWREALGLKNSDIANIFKGKNGISIDKDGNQYTISYTGTGSGTGTGGITENEVRTIIKKYIGGDDIDSSTGSTDNIVTHNVSKQETTNNKNIIAAINKINQEGIGFVHVNGEKLTLNANGKSENDSSAEGKNAIAIGPKSRAVGNNSIAIGVDNVVTGKNSGAFGDPNTVSGNNSYAVGNDNTVKSNDTFVLGNNVEVGADMQGAVVLGNDSKADKATKVSSAKVGDIIYDGFAGQAKGEGMILSVGAENAERQIKNVAAGEISKDSTDAVNGSQLYATNNIIGNVAKSVKNVIGGNAKVNNNGEISASDIGGTGQKDINHAIAYVNNRIKSKNAYISIDVPEGSEVPIASKGSNSIAIGAGSSDDRRKNVVSVGNAKTGLNRTITNVAPGKYGTDAVNMNQLYGVAGGLSKQINDVKKKSSAGIAGAVALGMLPQSNIPGDALVSIGTGYHDSESAVALGISKTSDNARWIFKGGVSYDSQDEVTAGASVGFHF